MVSIICTSCSHTRQVQNKVHQHHLSAQGGFVQAPCPREQSPLIKESWAHALHPDGGNLGGWEGYHTIGRQCHMMVRLQRKHVTGRPYKYYPPRRQHCSKGRRTRILHKQTKKQRTFLSPSGRTMFGVMLFQARTQAHAVAWLPRHWKGDV